MTWAEGKSIVVPATVSPGGKRPVANKHLLTKEETENTSHIVIDSMKLTHSNFSFLCIVSAISKAAVVFELATRIVTHCEKLLIHFFHFHNSLFAIAALAAQNKESNHRKLRNTSSKRFPL